MLKLQRGHDTTAKLLLEQRDLLDKLGDRLAQLESSCAAGRRRVKTNTRDVINN